MSCRIDAYSGRGTLVSLQESWNRKKHNVHANMHVYNEWHDLLPIAHNSREDHLVILVVARAGTLSRHRYMDKLPEQIERYFSARNLMLIYPIQLATTGGSTALLRGGMPVNVR